LIIKKDERRGTAEKNKGDKMSQGGVADLIGDKTQ
jgi:hypothetical protein